MEPYYASIIKNYKIEEKEKIELLNKKQTEWIIPCNPHQYIEIIKDIWN